MMDLHPARLYTNNNAAASFSVADTIRLLFQEGQKVSEIMSILDSHHPSTTSLCCATPTTALLTYLARVLLSIMRATGKKNLVVISIGSGSGLFEYLLEEHLERHDHHFDPVFSSSSIQIVGVDVAPVNVFLTDIQFHVVRDNIFPLELNLVDVAALIAIYLRRPSILCSYLQWFPHVEKIILVGPRTEDPVADPIFAAALSAWGTLEAKITAEDNTINHARRMIAPWDVMQIYTKK
jgi:hypothetical protein